MPSPESESARKRSRPTAARRRASDSAAPPNFEGWWFTRTAKSPLPPAHSRAPASFPLLSRWSPPNPVPMPPPPQVTGLGVHHLQFAFPVEEGHVDAPPVRRVEMDKSIVQFPERRIPEQPAQDKGILHLRHPDDVRQPTRHRRAPKEGFRHSLALGTEAPPRPPPASARGKIRIRHARGIVPVVKKVLQIPKDCRQRVPRRVRPRQKQQPDQPRNHCPSKEIFINSLPSECSASSILWTCCLRG